MKREVKQKWSQHEPYGVPIVIDEQGFRFRFIAFKVPLSTESDWNLRKMVEDFPDLSLVIDLCGTKDPNKYYTLENLETLMPHAQFKKIGENDGKPQSIPADATVQE